jgi:hypothetical protein
MQAILDRKFMLVVFLAVLFFTPGVYPQDTRHIPIEVNLIVDGSAALKNAGDEAIQWLSGNLVEGLLREGDRITIWNAGEKARIVYSDTLAGADGKENIKKNLRSLTFQGNSADFSGALREAAQGAGSSGASGPAMTYTLLISGSSSALSPLLMGAGANLLRYSRVEEFSAWRALVIALDINSQVQRAAAAYLAGI